jgi:outer membrane usher protein
VTDILFPPAILRAAEQPYIAERIDCDGIQLVRLNSSLSVRYLENAQEVRITPAPAQLGNQSIDIAAKLLAENVREVQPVFGVDYGVRGSVGYAANSGASAAPGTASPSPASPGTEESALRFGEAVGYLGVGASTDRASGYVGVTATRDVDGVLTTDIRATAQYTVNDDLAVYAGYHAAPGPGHPTYDSSLFSGVGVAYRRGVQRLLPSLKLELPEPATITLYVNNQRLTALEAAAGTLELLNIPLQGAGEAEINLLIEDETGVSRKTVRAPSVAAGLGAGALVLGGVAGHDGAGWTASVSGQYGLTPATSLGVQAQGSTVGTYSLAGQVLYSSELLAGTLGAAVNRGQVGAELQAPRVTVTASASAIRTPLVVSGNVVADLNEFRQSSVGVRATYDARPWYFGLGASSRLTPNTWAVQGSVSRQISSQWGVTAGASLRPGGAQVRIGTSYVFSPKWRASAEAGLAGGQLSPSGSVTFTPDSTQTLALSVQPEAIVGSYLLNRSVHLALSANYGGGGQFGVGQYGAFGELSGAVTAMNGRLTFQPRLSQYGVLLRTGVPGLTVRVNGKAVGLTDARGELLMTELPSGQSSTVGIAPNELPIGVAFESTTLNVLPALNGITVIDWRSNFKVSGFMRFSWSSTEVAANADLYLNGERIFIDDEGYGLVPVLNAATPAELRSQDGARRCTLSLQPGATAASCAAGP